LKLTTPSQNAESTLAPAPGTGAPGKAGHAPPTHTLRLNVDAALRRKARTVRSSDLAARVEKVQVLGLATIKGFIQEAVDDAVAQLDRQVGESERQRLLEEAEESFRERLAVFQSEKADLEARGSLLQRELEKATALLEEERQRIVSASQFTVSDAGMVEIEQRMARLLDRAVTANGVSGDLEEEMRRALLKLLDDERDKIRAKAQEAQSDKVQLLERKIQRLAQSLEETEKQRDSAQRRAEALESAGLLPRNVMKAGLDADDPCREKKLNLLKEVFRENKALRRTLEESSVLPQPDAAKPDQAGAAPDPVQAAEEVVGEHEVELDQA
jgi:hypothetical protein